MRCVYFLWFFLCALHAEAVTLDNPTSAAGIKAGRHRHLQHIGRPFRIDQDLSPSQHKSNKLRHHKVDTEDATKPNYKLNSSFAKGDKFPKLKELGKRLETMRSPMTTTTTTERTPYFFASKTKDRPKWKYVHDYDDVPESPTQTPIEDVDEEYDAEDDDMDDAYIDEVAPTTTTTTTEASTKRLASKTKSYAYEDETPDEDANDDYYDDEIFAEDTYRPQHDVQAEEGLQGQSPMTQYKWQKYGTRQALEESQRDSDFGNERKNVHAAHEHYLHMKAAAKCHRPRPRVISVQEVHQLPGKAFRPHCTVLHRCGDDTGCCQGQGKKCRAKTQELIHLHFYVYSTTFSQLQTVERLAFHNHTECACQDEAEMKISQRLIRSRGHYNQNSLQQDNPSCKCSEEFVSTMNHRFGRCACDCPPGSDNLSGCTNMKRGKEHLSLRDRKCILENKCTPPTCEYGVYAKHKGRCPRRHEMAGTRGNTLTTRSDSEYEEDSIED